jgi:hypothetical protein
MNRSRLLPLAVLVCAFLALPGLAGASSLRSRRSVAGVRATVAAYDNAVLAGKATTACSLLTAAAQKQIAKTNHLPTCEKTIEFAYQLLKASPKQAAQVRSYASKVKITLHGDTATVPKFNGGGRGTLSYVHGLWYVSG